MKKILISTAAFGAMLVSATTASAGVFGDVSVSASTDYVSEYVFRGVSFASTAVQPGVEVGLGGFSAGVWASAGLGGSSANASDEIDVYAGYGWNVTEKLSASVGATIFHFPDSGGLFNFDSEELGSTFEVYGGVAYDTLLAPAFTAYYDFTLDAFTLEGSVSHSFPVANKTSFDLGVTGGLVLASDGGVDDGTDNDSDYSWATGSASLGYAYTDSTSFYVGANYTVNSDDSLDFNDTTSDDTLFWVGTGFSTGF